MQHYIKMDDGTIILKHPERITYVTKLTPQYDKILTNLDILPIEDLIALADEKFDSIYYAIFKQSVFYIMVLENNRFTYYQPNTTNKNTYTSNMLTNYEFIKAYSSLTALQNDYPEYFI